MTSSAITMNPACDVTGDLRDLEEVAGVAGGGRRPAAVTALERYISKSGAQP